MSVERRARVHAALGEPARLAAHGRAVDGAASGTVRLRDESGRIALAEPRPGGTLKPVVGFRG